MTNVGDDALIIIIPNLGCSVCYQAALDFARQNYRNKALFIVSTGFTTKKKINLEFGKEISERDNFYWDKNMKIFDWKLVSNSPVYLYINGGKITEVGEITSKNQNHVLVKLKHFLSEIK